MFEFIVLWFVNLNFVIMLIVGDEFFYLFLLSCFECRVYVFYILFKIGFLKKYLVFLIFQVYYNIGKFNLDLGNIEKVIFKYRLVIRYVIEKVVCLYVGQLK